jgi:hypothetical protein
MTDPAAPPTGTAPPVDPAVVPTGTMSVADAQALDAAKAAAAGIWPKTGALSREDALAKITALKANKEWSAKYLSGDADARKEMVEAVRAAHGSPDTDNIEMAARLAALQRHGLPDLNTDVGKDLAAVMSGKPISGEVHRAAHAKRSAMMADKSWVQRYLDGDQEARRQFTTVNVLLAAQVERRAS